MKITIALFAFLLIPFTHFSQLQAGFSYDDSICVDDCIIFTDTTIGNAVSYTWAFQGGTPATSTLANPGLICFDTDGVYQVGLTVTDAMGGMDTRLSQIVVGKYPDSLFAFGDTTIAMGGSAVITAAGYPSSLIMSISPKTDVITIGDGLDFEVLATPYLTTSYIISYSSFEGCTITDTATVTVEFLDVVDVPNTFSPDDNGVNDVVYVKGPGILTMTFRIYDRYGRKMYETSDQAEGWDGTFNGVKLLPATFAWTCEYTLVGGLSDVKSGTITLIK